MQQVVCICRFSLKVPETVRANQWFVKLLFVVRAKATDKLALPLRCVPYSQVQAGIMIPKSSGVHKFGHGAGFRNPSWLCHAEHILEAIPTGN
jgi:hypothetical protein